MINIGFRIYKGNQWVVGTRDLPNGQVQRIRLSDKKSNVHDIFIEDLKKNFGSDLILAPEKIKVSKKNITIKEGPYKGVVFSILSPKSVIKPTHVKRDVLSKPR